VKQYPSILHCTGQSFREFVAHVFDKLDGSNLRFEWNRKQGWYKTGSRHVLLDETHPILGGAVPLFHSSLADPLARIARDNRWDSLVVFAEYWGPQSFAGLHVPGDPMKLTLFDAAPYKQGIMPPQDFLKLFGHLEIPRYLGKINWTRAFVTQVWRREIEGITFEGVVGKAKEGRHDLVMAKAKTEGWITQVRARFAPEEAEKIIAS
jgi:hypothetical protein